MTCATRGWSPADTSETAASLSPWCLSRTKRLFDLASAALVLIVLWPVLLLLGLLVKTTSSGPALFRQNRVGKDGREFTLLKFRTMTYNRSDAGPGVTTQGDSRITAIGRALRKWKLDELPQFINVLAGNMSLVGPRPDLAEFWAMLSPDQRPTLCLRPGITGRATLEFRDEEAILCKVPQEQLTEYYLRSVLPEKIRLDWEYAKQANFMTDCKILVTTLRRI